MYAAEKGYKDDVATILKAGVDTTVRNKVRKQRAVADIGIVHASHILYILMLSYVGWENRSRSGVHRRDSKDDQELW